MSKEWITAPKLFGRDSNRWAGGLIVLVLAVGLVAAFLEGRDRRSLRSSLVPGNPMPSYAPLSMDGTEIPISDFLGSVVLLNFWASWCSSCIDQLSDMQLLRHELEARGLKIISVNLDREDRAGVQEFWDRGGYGWLNLFDDPGRVEEAFGWGDRYPKTVLVNRDGTVGVWWQGRLDLTGAENRAFIEQAISGRAVWNEQEGE